MGHYGIQSFLIGKKSNRISFFSFLSWICYRSHQSSTEKSETLKSESSKKAAEVSDEELARLLYFELNGTFPDDCPATPTPPPPPPPQSSKVEENQRESKGVFHRWFPLFTAAPASVKTNSVHKSNIQHKACGHNCSFSSLDRCCACMDQRPLQREGTYPRYIDGSGWQQNGLRRDGYCPVCKSSRI